MRWCGVLLALLILAGSKPVSDAMSEGLRSSPANISNTRGDSKRPAVAVGADGSVHAVWEDYSPGNWEIFYASKEAGGAWSPPVNVSNDPGGSFRPAVVVAPEGSVHVAWHDDTPGDYEIFYAGKPPNGDWSAPVNISGSAAWSYWPSITIGTDGSLYVAWHDDTPGNWEVLIASRGTDGGWSPTINISESAGTSFVPKLLAAGDGSVEAVWQDNTSGAWEILAASRLPQGSWSAPVNLSSTEGDSAPFSAARSPDGSLQVVWREATSGGSRLLWATKAPGQSWSAPKEIDGPASSQGALSIGSGTDGSLHLVWEESGPGNQEVFLGSRAPSGAWSSPSNLSNSPQDSTLGGLAVGGDGSLHAVWRDGMPDKGDILYWEGRAGPSSVGGAAPEGTIGVRLTRGCNLVTSGYPDSTAAETLAGAVSPAQAVLALWKRERGDWLGYSPSHPRVSDRFRQDSRGLFFICTSGEAEFFMPT